MRTIHAAILIFLCLVQLSAAPATMQSPGNDKPKFVHIRYEDGIEAWCDLATQRLFVATRVGGTLQEARLIDYRHKLIRGCFAAEKQGWQENVDTLPPFPDSPLACALLPNERAWFSVPHLSVEEHQDVLAGKPALRADLYCNGPEHTRFLVKRAWADPQTKLPFRIEKFTTTGASTKADVDTSNSGPEDLHDLDIPLEVKFIDNDASTPEAVKIVSRSKKAVQPFLRPMRRLRWGVGPDDKRSASIMTWDDKRLRVDSYASRKPAKKEKLIEQADDVLRWIDQEAVCRQTTIITPDYSYEFDARAEDATNITWRPNVDPDLSSWLRVYLGYWPQVQHIGANEVVADAKDIPDGCIVLRQDRGSDVRKFAVDPKHGEICRLFTLDIKATTSCAQRIELLDLVELPQDRWNPTRQTFNTLEVRMKTQDVDAKACEVLDAEKILHQLHTQGRQFTFGGF
ncbi:MAG TPA: hypothetical protein VF669_05910 [Tepidisphaeraceae bacterium]